MTIDNVEKQKHVSDYCKDKIEQYEQALQAIAVWDVWCRADAQDVVEIARQALNLEKNA